MQHAQRAVADWNLDKPLNPKPRVAVVSPFLDKRHGTERRVIEWISAIADRFEIHIYSHKIEDLDVSKITWHRIPRLPGPHLFGFLWWFFANHLWRFWDDRVGGLRYDLVFAPGINCLNADVVSVHIVFAEYLRKVAPELVLTRHGISAWPRVLHRRLYYRLIELLERRVYTRAETELILIARKTAAEIERLYRPCQNASVLYLGLDQEIFNPCRRVVLRHAARAEMAISPERFVILLVGNDWRNKGVPVLLEALVKLRELPIDLVVVSREQSTSLEAQISEHGLVGRVRILPPRKDIEFYYAAADLYAGPSLEDTFALPPAEAMACGLPVVVSTSNGASEIITHGVDGLILEDPRDAHALATIVKELFEDAQLRATLAEGAVRTASKYSWAQNGRQLTLIFEEILRRKSLATPHAVAEEL